ncbi:MAG: hypothetical protein R8K22_09680, partial [Mariprofundaceae bacterium]
MILWRCVFIGVMFFTSAAWAAPNAIKPLQTGDWNAFQPALLMDGSVLFVTDFKSNLDLVLWQQDGTIELWDDYPSDDYAPVLSTDGKQIIFISTRAHARGSVFTSDIQAHKIERSELSMVEHRKTLMTKRFQVRYPFDSNHDGQKNNRDLAWVVDAFNDDKPLTPLSMDARDPVEDTMSGALWFSYKVGDGRRLARIEQPSKDIKPDLAQASMHEWKLLQIARAKFDSIILNEALWAAGYQQAVADHLKDMVIEYKKDLRYQWQRERLYINQGRKSLSIQQV